MKKGLKLKYLFASLLTTGFLFLWAGSVFADTQIYPIPPATTPYGDGAGNITNAGWTNTHLLGQTFIVPSGINTITKVRLTRFKLGSSGGSAGGIVSVALFQGEPSVSNQCWNRGLGGDECTNVISASGARAAKKEKIYIGGQIPNQFNDLCGWGGRSYPDNNVITYLLKRMRINDPNNPCPKKSELQRMWDLFGAKGWGGLQGDWRNGGDSCGGCDGWWYPWELPDNYGGSDFLWPDFVNQSDVGAGPTYFEGPGWTTQTATWQGTDSDDNYIDVTFGSNVVVPGLSYFLSIQQSHTNPNNDPDRNTFNVSTDEYYEEGQWNCENPNEAINPSEPGYITISGATSMDGHFCGKGNVFVAQVSQNNPYPSGRTYINSDKWVGDSTTDVTYLTIWGTLTAYPTASIISGPPSGITGQTLDYSSQIFNAQSGTNYVTRQDNAVFTCPSGIVTDSTGRRWCNFRTFTGGSSGSIFSGSFTFQETGTYVVTVNAYANPTASFTASNSTECTGNPYPYNASQWSDCGSSDNITVTITNQPPGLGPMSIVAGSDASNPGAAGVPLISGLRSTESGSNFKNSINITQNLTNSNITNTNLVGSAFFKSFVPGEGSGIFGMTYSAGWTGGFVLIYAPQTANTYYSSTSPVGYNWIYYLKTFSAGKFYVYNGTDCSGPIGSPTGCWSEYSSTDPTAKYGDTSKGFDVKLNSLNPLKPTTPTFNVHFYKALGSGTWKTYGVLRDATGAESSLETVNP
ncbi:hypothetical protein A2867_00095 [Candidatus Daviesbacteria bacterium RIFCSPHIGHO2_01_FULL_40_11]|uniref:PKD domain-containing protein n=1 Tax=Candidatus Daviesbacteria bacterium RIFCSPHIGHO2_01_FULL_40_11 TaxID=1797762 RepID=A0A1F5JKH5_9BACT|nr:MAG: hypothetical protein A2867_00095 [Candidatus Daviesbacteria bacterium RIFCSPHIGHO2_01_FULL_40_11]